MYCCLRKHQTCEYFVGGKDSLDSKILSRANSLIAHNNIRSVILEIKTTDVKL